MKLERFFLTLDEPTNVSDITLVMIFIRRVDKNYEVFHFLILILFKGNAWNPLWKNVRCITTSYAAKIYGLEIEKWLDVCQRLWTMMIPKNSFTLYYSLTVLMRDMFEYI